MLRIKLLLACLFATLFVFAQNDKEALKVEHYKLKNGLSIYLNVDKTQPNVFGAVVIKGGSKRDPQDATGIAHYFEHIMFKGTDKLGTTDYEKEKPILDSIKLLYDKLATLSTDAEKDTIQMEINKLSIRAAEYAIPNELDRTLSKMGGTGVNAFTSNEMIAYHNSFPANQMEKWMKVYSDRFINPVFRMFQSELETVYEEKNMSMDDFSRNLFKEINENLFKGHPYENTVLGSIEHLKTPSLTKMMEYFETYYVANNMALVLVGNFDIETVKPLIEENFGIWHSGEIPPMPEYTPEPFGGRKLVTKRLTPIKIGVMAFRTVGKTHEDQVPMELVNNLLSNGSSTGVLDKLYMDNKLLAVGANAMNFSDMGANMILFAPKLIGQRLKTAENLVYEEIQKIKKGEFEDDMLEAIKVNLKKNFNKMLETSNNRGYFLMQTFLTDVEWEEFLTYPDKIDKVTKEDVIRIANKYYGDDYFVLHSKMGFPKKDKLPKPNYKPISPKNSEAKSEFACMIDEMEVEPEALRFIDFNKDVAYEDLKENVHYYYSKNSINDIFSIRLKFGQGSFENPLLDQATSYLSLVGTEKHSFEEFKKELQKIGARYYAYCSDDYTTIYIDGLNENFEPTLVLINELLTSMKGDEKQLKKLISNQKSNLKFESKSPQNVGYALYEYAVYGEKSRYLDRLSLKEIKALESENLFNAIKEAMKYEVDIHYVSTTNTDEEKAMIQKYLVLNENLKKTTSPHIRPRVKHEERTVFLTNDKKAIQSQISLYMQGATINEEDRPYATAFNEYFGGGMSSIVFQEVREFRSLAYSCWARYMSPYYNGDFAYLRGGMSTQSDKTTEALQVFDSLIAFMPEKENRIEDIRLSLVQSINSGSPSFRNVSSWVEYWRKKGYTEDPRIKYVEVYKTLEFVDIMKFYKKNLNQSPLIITISGDEKRMNLEEISKFGIIKNVKKKELFKK